MSTKSIELCSEQIDRIVIDELVSAAEITKHDKDQTLFVSLINVIKYYTVPDEYESILQQLNLL